MKLCYIILLQTVIKWILKQTITIQLGFISPREIDREGIRKKWEKRPLDVPSSFDAKVTWAWRLKKQAMSAPISQGVFFFFFFHSSYFQFSQEQKWPAIKTLLKHFCCCQRPRGGVPSPNAEMLSPRSSSPPLSILWAGRCKMSNNLIWASKFYSAFSRQERGGVACASVPSYDIQSWTF